MTEHKFKIGQIVEPASGPSNGERPRYQIASLVPSEGREPHYRVKREGSPERIVREAQIRFVADAPLKPDRPGISISKR